MAKNCYEMCKECRYAEWDYIEGFGYGRMIRYAFIDGCKKGFEPIYDEEEETYECEGYKSAAYR